MGHRSTALALALATLCASCADTFRGSGTSPAVTAVAGEQLFAALAARYTQIDREPRYDAARIRLAKAALVPSRVFDDSTMWLARPTPAVRVMLIDAGLAGGRYHIAMRPTVAYPLKPGDSRHTILLQRTAPSVYEWQTSVDFAIGSITAGDAEAIFSALVAAPEGRGERELRGDYAAAFPRAAAAFGRGFSVDSVRAAPGALGTTSVALTLGFHPETMAPAFPAFASYLDKYLKHAKYHFVVSDRAGAPMFDILGGDRSMTFRYRVQQRRLVSLLGPPRPLTDTLVLRADASLKVKMFTVAFHDLVTEFVVTRTPHERMWTVTGRREPQWDLPLVTERVLRTPLKRPFEGAGALFEIGVRDSGDAQTVIARRTRLAVQESAIMRFIGSLGAHVVGDIDGRVAAEQDRFLREGFAALGADLRTHAP
jgi:hypothetical protein